MLIPSQQTGFHEMMSLYLVPYATLHNVFPGMKHMKSGHTYQPKVLHTGIVSRRTLITLGPQRMKPYFPARHYLPQLGQSLLRSRMELTLFRRRRYRVKVPKRPGCNDNPSPRQNAVGQSRVVPSSILPLHEAFLLTFVFEDGLESTRVVNL
jgi:hypothetical protein